MDPTIGRVMILMSCLCIGVSSIRVQGFCSQETCWKMVDRVDKLEERWQRLEQAFRRTLRHMSRDDYSDVLASLDDDPLVQSYLREENRVLKKKFKRQLWHAQPEDEDDDEQELPRASYPAPTLTRGLGELFHEVLSSPRLAGEHQDRVNSDERSEVSGASHPATARGRFQEVLPSSGLESEPQDGVDDNKVSSASENNEQIMRKDEQQSPSLLPLSSLETANGNPTESQADASRTYQEANVEIRQINLQLMQIHDSITVLQHQHNMTINRIENRLSELAKGSDTSSQQWTGALYCSLAHLIKDTNSNRDSPQRFEEDSRKESQVEMSTTDEDSLIIEFDFQWEGHSVRCSEFLTSVRLRIYETDHEVKSYVYDERIDRDCLTWNANTYSVILPLSSQFEESKCQLPVANLEGCKDYTLELIPSFHSFNGRQMDLNFSPPPKDESKLNLRYFTYRIINHKLIVEWALNSDKCHRKMSSAFLEISHGGVSDSLSVSNRCLVGDNTHSIALPIHNILDQDNHDCWLTFDHVQIKYCHKYHLQLSMEGWFLDKLRSPASAMDIFISRQGSSTSCDLLSSPNGTITSPNYPGAYNDGINASWLISVQAGHVIQLQFSTFDTEISHDKVTVHDGSDTASPVLLSHSGPTLPSALQSTGNNLFITMTTDSRDTRPGFAANYSSVALT